MLEAVLFDMDGLLVDSEPLWYEAERAVMQRLGGQWAVEDQHVLLGGSLDQTVTYLLARGTVVASREQVGRWLHEEMARLLGERDLPLLPGVGNLHAELTAAGVPSALVTSSQPEVVEAVIESTGLCFDAIVTGADVQRGKPDPEPYQRAAGLLGTDPVCCVALEDSPTGAASALAAGCVVVVVPTIDLPPEKIAGVSLITRSLANLDLQRLDALVRERHSRAGFHVRR